MVERVAPGRIMVPAAAALTVMAAGVLDSRPAAATGRQATLEIRVQVVEPCRIRIAPSGTLEQSCLGSGSVGPPVTVRLDELVERLGIGLPERPPRPALPAGFGDAVPLSSPSGSISSGFVVPSTASARIAAANQRAGAIATTISQRVRFITVAF